MTTPAGRHLGAFRRAAALVLGLGIVPATAIPAASGDGIARVLAVVDLPREPVDGLRPDELSALAWDPRAQALYAASDRGRLFRLDLHHDATGRLEAVSTRSGIALRDPRNGAPIGVEAMTWRIQYPDEEAELLLAPEHGTTAWRLDLGDVTPVPLDWPAGVHDAALGRDSAHGVEAMDWHDVHGVIAAAQRTATPGQHVAHAHDGSRYGWRMAAPGSVVKAIEVMSPNRLLVLERWREPGTDRWMHALRGIELTRCRLSGSAPPCDAPVWHLRSPLLDGRDNLEGLACPRSDRCLVVSDAKPREGRPGRLVQVELPWP